MASAQAPSTGTIYGLHDPGTGELRYVGKTITSLSLRLRRHVSGAYRVRDDRVSNSHLSNWVRSLSSAPRILPILEDVPISDLNKREIEQIAKHRLDGRLTNSADGGEGPTGVIRSPEVRARLSRAHADVPLSDRHRTAIAAGMKGKPGIGYPRGRKQSAEHVAARANSNRHPRGQYITAAFRENVVSALQGVTG